MMSLVFLLGKMLALFGSILSLSSLIVASLLIVQHPTQPKPKKPIPNFLPLLVHLVVLVFYILFFHKLIRQHGMFQCLLAFLNEVVLLSTTSMASSNAQVFHLLLMMIGLDLLTFRCFIAGSCDLEDGRIFSLSWMGWSSNPFHLL